MTPELHRPFPIERIGPTGQSHAVTVTATKEECVALALRMGVPAIRSVVCDFRLRRETDAAISAQGRLRARVTQTCIVSLDDFAVNLTEDFRIRFVPAGAESDNEDPESEDELGYEGVSIDLGEATAEQLGLALDPYPRKPDAALPENEPEAKPHPFAALAALRKP